MYISNIEPNRNTIGLPEAPFNAQSVSCNDIPELCGDWRLLGEIVNLVVAAINGGGNAVH